MFRLETILILFLVFAAHSQSPLKSPDKNRETPENGIFFSDGQNCEQTAALVSPLIKHVPVDKNIIIVAYKGKNEKVSAAQRRLRSARKYFTETFRETRYARSPEKIITALGTADTEAGTIEFYVDGILSLAFYFRKNRDFILQCNYEP